MNAEKNAGKVLGSIALIFCVWAVCYLPNLGGFALTDIDEAHNAECGREMFLSGNWLVPTFNYDLRTDKPPLLYWFMQGTYSLMGINEWGARLPSAITTLGTLLLVFAFTSYFLDRATGVLAAIILSTAWMFGISGHAVTPDALLIFNIVGSMMSFFAAYQSQNPRWLLLTGVFTGLAILSKGPVGLALPGLIGLVFLLWEGQLAFIRKYWRWACWAISIALMISVPWYVMVGLETRWEFIRGFWGTHNLSRFTTVMEGHKGPFYYHLLVLMVGFAPWSIIIGLAFWTVIRRVWRKSTDEVVEVVPSVERSLIRLLLCWVGIWLAFFSVAATKLPNYVLPIYPAIAILISRTCILWLRQEIHLPKWVSNLCLASLLLLGIGLGAGLWVASGQASFLLEKLQYRVVPELVKLFWLPVIPVGAACACWWFLRRNQRRAVLLTVVSCSVVLLASIGNWVTEYTGDARCISSIANAFNADAGDENVRLGTHPRFYRPSLVFYVRRNVDRLLSDTLADVRADEYLRSPFKSYMIIAEKDWPSVQKAHGERVIEIARQYDFTIGQQVLLIRNQPTMETSRK